VKILEVFYIYYLKNEIRKKFKYQKILMNLKNINGLIINCMRFKEDFNKQNKIKRKKKFKR